MNETHRWPEGAGDSEWAAAVEEFVAALWGEAHRRLAEKGVVLDPQALIEALTDDVAQGRRRARAARAARVPAQRRAGGRR